MRPWIGSALTSLFFVGTTFAGERPGSFAGTGTGLDLVDVDVMFVGAHPDDDTGVLATFARYLRDEGFKGTVVTLTGGEGGGNATGREAGPALGLIRQEEERRSLALVGVTAPQFLGLQDFYFTLSAEEVQARWGDAFLCDVIRRVRLERPEVIVTMWPGPGTHGMHQMAARAATLAYARAGDPAYCPDQISREFLKPFSPAKLYYYPNDPNAPGVVKVPSSDDSRSAGMRYADLRALAARNYRSQGFDQFSRVPAADAQPDAFLLVASRVPVLDKETHLLQGALLPAGASPPGVRLEALPERFEAGLAADLAVRVRFANETAEPMRHVDLSLEAPAGWSLTSQGSTSFETVGVGRQVEVSFALRPAGEAEPDTLGRLVAAYAADWEGRRISGANRAFVRVVAPLGVSFHALYDVAGYRELARATRTEWVIPALPSRLPLVVGRTTPVVVDLENRGAEPLSGALTLQGPLGVSLERPVPFAVAAHATARVSLPVRVEPQALAEGRHAARLKVSLSASSGAIRSHDVADAYLLPALTIPRVSRPPSIDGDLSDMVGFAHGRIGPGDLWWREAPKDAADLSADFSLAYDARALYVGLRVRDDAVVCNIAPDDVKAQLRSDAVGVTVDPSGHSHDTSSTLQAAAFPCTTEGFAARGFRDADARPGLMEETAPGMQVASRRTEDGYLMELAIPWSAMPQQPKPGDEIGVNLVLYDGDARDARVGANVSQSGLAWAAFEWGGKQALPYLWPRVVLGR
jgi:LmbE family N-acetylglucosaminyl deacetylase